MKYTHGSLTNMRTRVYNEIIIFKKFYRIFKINNQRITDRER